MLVKDLAGKGNENQLEKDTAAYFCELSPEARAEEDELADASSRGAEDVDFDRE